MASGTGDDGDDDVGRDRVRRSGAPSCHGSDGEPARAARRWPAWPTACRSTTTSRSSATAAGEMPGWDGTLSDEEIDAVVDYERDVLSDRPTAADPSPATGLLGRSDDRSSRPASRRKASLAPVGRSRDGGVVGRPSPRPSRPRRRQQVGPHRVEQVVVGRGRRPGRRPRQRHGRPPTGPPGAGSTQLGHGHRPVQAHDRRRRDDQQLVVQGHDLPPVGRRRPSAASLWTAVRWPPGSGTARAGRGAGTGARGPGPRRRRRRSQPPAVLVGQEHDVARRAVCGPVGGPRISSISASRPSASGSSGIRSTSTRPRRTASAQRSSRTRSVARRAV